MSIFTKTIISAAIVLTANATFANEAKSEKQAKQTTELRQSVFKLLGSNMGPLGGMAKGKLPFNAETVEKHAIRINQLSYMIADYTRTDTSKFNVKTEALDKIWSEKEAFKKRINDLSEASATLQKVAMSGSEMDIKKAIGGVGKTCGGCHDDFKKD